MSETIEPGTALARNDTALRLAIADAAVAYHDRSRTGNGTGLRAEWERLAGAIAAWRAANV